MTDVPKQVAPPDVTCLGNKLFADLHDKEDIVETIRAEQQAIKATRSAVARILQEGLAWQNNRDVYEDNTSKGREFIVERFYNPFLNAWVVGRSRANLRVTFGKFGRARITWNCRGNIATYEIKHCKAATYNVLKAKGVVEFCWTDVSRLQVQWRPIAPNQTIEPDLFAYAIPTLKVWVPIDRIGPWWWELGNDKAIVDKIGVERLQGSETVPPKYRFRSPKTLLPN